MDRFAERIDLAPLSAVLARVTYQMIVLDYKHNPARYQDPVEGIHNLRRELSAARWEALACWLVAFSYAMGDRGFSSKQARDYIVDRAVKAEANRRRGRPWARVPESCPRVTNRGAASRHAADSAKTDDGVAR